MNFCGRRCRNPGFQSGRERRHILENALIKAEGLYSLAGRPVIAETSGLCVEALGGRPGIESARYGAQKAAFSLRRKKTGSFLAELAM